MSISPDFLELLVHPVHKTPLKTSTDATLLEDGIHPERFPIKEGVPILLTTALNETLTDTEHHRQAGTSFQYKEHYQNDAAAYDYTEEARHPVEREEINRLRQNILSEIPAEGKWILDVGCGGAWLAKSLVPRGRHVISMDISDINPIKALREVSKENHHAVVADVFELPFRKDSLDCIIASEIIEHVPDPGRFLSELYQVLKPGGKLIVTTPYNELIRTSLCIHCNRLTPHNAHLHSFTEDSIRQYLPAGMQKISTRIFNSKLLVKAHLQKMLSFLPLSVYATLDQLAVALTGKKAYRLMVVIEK